MASAPAGDGYLTVEEFAALPSAAHHAVWAAHAAGCVDSIPAASGAGRGITRRYRRDQVAIILGVEGIDAALLPVKRANRG